VPTLPCKLPHAKHVNCNAFSSVDCELLLKEPVLWSGGSEKNRLLTADVLNDAPSPLRMYAVMLSIDQRPCRRSVNGGGGWEEYIPLTFWHGRCNASYPPPLAATNWCQSSQCHIQLSVDCHSSSMNGDIWRWHSSNSYHSLEDRLMKLANTTCYINEQGC